MTQNAISVCQTTWLWMPAELQAISQKRISGWLVIPHGDTINSAQSSNCVHEVVVIVVSNDYIVRKLVLYNYVNE